MHRPKNLANPGDPGIYESFLSSGNHPVQYRNRQRVLKIGHTGDLSGDEDQVKMIEQKDHPKILVSR